ncbi:hypothetical protein SARC_11591 [Sphaeroforma arctica JP610]|uniref:Calponin-homology (CH) domain-containing protein n=1 Tax=Sphaeroforma arctica JP610 TaxID=667725 RepID=A0A0L0FIM2_9EUKA|nr:hypothetical protein SARC_11591 [Sphaeroforma arctica JP610]KNC75893.1 hypothetical protein SARC_11591 [Sphaeroforma arctica JP610]|eukprot:XP_014149795.1 hypothetical protein SARC_11591 [Sphaeroforma arctica JP610]
MANKHTAFGLDADLEAKKAAKYDFALEAEAMAWLKAVTDQSPAEGQSVHEFLKDGQVLCNLANTLKDGAVKRVNTSKMAFKQMENINSFLEAVTAYGVPVADLFATVDLFEDKNMGQVVITLHAVGRAAQKNNFKGPVLGAKIAEKNERNFSQEQLDAGKFTPSQQAGNNKGASQKGMFTGRREIDVLTHNEMLAARAGGN